MRRLIFIASLALASCGGGQTANNSAVSEETGAEEIGSLNDTTAIDAATGEAANMAADVNYTFNEEAMNAASNNTSAKASARTAPAAPRPKPAPTNTAPPPATENSASTTNTTD
jgi:hypothetical protein